MLEDTRTTACRLILELMSPRSVHQQEGLGLYPLPLWSLVTGTMLPDIYHNPLRNLYRRMCTKSKQKEPFNLLILCTGLSPSPHQGAQQASSSSARPKKFQQKQPRRFFPTTKHNFFHNGLQKAIAKTHPSKIQLKLRTEFLYVHF